MQVRRQPGPPEGPSRRRYGKVARLRRTSDRLSEDGTELLFESEIPVSQGWSDVCFVLPVESCPTS